MKKTRPIGWATPAAKKNVPPGVPLEMIGTATDILDKAHRVVTTRAAYPNKDMGHQPVLVVVLESDLNNPQTRAHAATISTNGRLQGVALDVHS